MRQTFADTLVLAQRSLRRIPRQPDLLTAFTIQPVMFTLLFVYVFGGAIQTPGYDDYEDFLIPGIVVQNIAFGGFVTALGLADDVGKGLIDRFRSLPMSRAAVLTGRTLADMATNLVGLTVLLLTGLLIGFRFEASALEVVGGILLMVLFGYAFSWIFALIGLLVSTPESANAFGFIAVFPLTFVSSAFVPIETFPAWLEAFAEVNPFTVAVNAMRHLWLDAPGEPGVGNVWGTVAWAVGLIAIFAPLAVARYRRIASN